MASSQKTSSKGQAWFCTTGLPSDVVVEVDEMTFHLHKFPLMSRSQKLHQLIMELESEMPKSKGKVREEEEGEGDLGHEQGGEEEGKEKSCFISLPDFPGGAETFEMAAKYCYGVKFDLAAENAILLRCAGEYLGMTDDFADDNLAARADRFLDAAVFPSPRRSIKALKSCESHLPAADDLLLSRRCIDAIAAAAISGSDDSAPCLGWRVPDEKSGTPPENPALWNGIDSGSSRHRGGGWVEDLAVLALPVFNRVIAGMKEKGSSSDFIEAALIAYAKNVIPGLTSRSTNTWKRSGFGAVIAAPEAEQRELLETVIANLPGRGTAATVKLLFGLLKTAKILGASDECTGGLERRLGERLEEAALDDLLLPSYSYLSETLYDVDCVERILRHFLDQLDETTASDGSPTTERRKLVAVGKLVDGYLSEIATDGNLKPERFYKLAVALPEDGRQLDDGVYRAVDVYLKAHPWVSDEEREKLAGAIDCQKLTMEACSHAAQNERLPVRAVVQVLFFEQLQLRQAITSSLLIPTDISGQAATSGNITPHLEAGGQNIWGTTATENQVLRLDMDSMRSRLRVLERECSAMRKVIAKVDGTAMAAATTNENRRGRFGWRLGCKLKAQVCDSHEKGSTLEIRRGRSGQQI